MFYVNMRNIMSKEGIGVYDTTDNTTELCSTDEIHDFTNLGIDIAFMRSSREEMLKDFTFHCRGTAFCIRGSSLYVSLGLGDFDLSGLIHRDEGSKLLEVDIYELDSEKFILSTTLVKDTGAYISGKVYVYILDIGVNVRGVLSVAEMNNFENLNSRKMLGLSNSSNRYVFGTRTIDINKELERIKGLYGFS